MTGSARVGGKSKAGARAKQTATAESKAWRGATLETVRKGSAVAIQALLNDLRAEGHIEQDAETDGAGTVADDELDVIDAEIDLEDEDEERPEDLDNAPAEYSEPAFRLGFEPQETDASPSFEPGLGIFIDGSECRFQLPRWAGLAARTDEGQRFLDELENRFLVLDQIAKWLSRERGGFLQTADPWALGVHAFEEFRKNQAPVSPQSFLAVTGIEKLASEESFSRYVRDCHLVWSDGTAPVAILFGSEARLAWVANAVTQSVRKQGRVLSQPLLDSYRDISKPRGREERRRILAASVDSLGFPELVMKATAIAGVGWSEVLAAYEERMIKEGDG